MSRQGTWDCDASGLKLQSMDSAHVCLVSVSLEAEGFDKFRCERAISLGVDMDSMGKVMRCAAKDDIITLSAANASPDTLKFTFEAADQERVSEYEMKLMTLEEEHLAIPDTEYTATVRVRHSLIRDILIMTPPHSSRVRSSRGSCVTWPSSVTPSPSRPPRTASSSGLLNTQTIYSVKSSN